MILRVLLLTVLVGLAFGSAYSQSQTLPENMPSGAPETAPPPAPSVTPTPDAKASATPAVDPIKMAQYRGYLQQSNDLLDRKQYGEALNVLQKAEEILGPNAITLNMRGAVMAKQKKFDEAKNLYDQAIKADPNFFPAEYNIGEIDFEKGNYDKAAEYFKKMLNVYPGNELLQFMVFICYMQMDNKPEAEKWMNEIRFPSNSPSWYYARAVWEIKNGNKSEAESYLRGSSYIFGDKNRLFDETLTQVNLLPIK